MVKISHDNISENTPALWIGHFPCPKSEHHKYDRGHSVILGGPIESTGAAKLAAHAALRIGAGLVSVACDRESLPIYAASFAAIMTKPFQTAEDFSNLIEDARVKSVLLGPGAGVTPRTKSLVLATLAAKKSAVLDADALSVFADDPNELFDAIKAPCVLTPHEGEFARLFGGSSQSRPERALHAAKRSNAIVLIKGSDTAIAAPDGRVVVNRQASPYLATAGSGDVLAGICAGLLAQGMLAFEATCASVSLHAQAAGQHGPGLIAEDIAEALPTLMVSLLKAYHRSL